jgi:hypothetical protein
MPELVTRPCVVYTWSDETARKRAKELVDTYRAILVPYGVDVFPLPGWPLSEEHRQRNERAATDLETGLLVWDRLEADRYKTANS